MWERAIQISGLLRWLSEHMTLPWALRDGLLCGWYNGEEYLHSEIWNWCMGGSDGCQICECSGWSWKNTSWSFGDSGILNVAMGELGGEHLLLYWPQFPPGWNEECWGYNSYIPSNSGSPWDVNMCCHLLSISTDWIPLRRQRFFQYFPHYSRHTLEQKVLNLRLFFSGCVCWPLAHTLENSDLSCHPCGLWLEGCEMKLSCSVSVPKLQMRNLIIQIEVLPCHSLNLLSNPIIVK